MLDMYLASHMEILYTMIRNKALIQVSGGGCVGNIYLFVITPCARSAHKG